MNLIEQIRVNDVSIDGYQGTYQTESQEWVRVIVDSEDKVLAGIKADGTVEWSVGVPTPVRVYVEQQVLPSIEEQLDLKVDKEEGMSLIDASIAESISLIESPEYIQVTTDGEDKIVMGIKPNGAVYIPILENDSIDLKVDDAIERIDASVEEALSNIGPVADYFSEIDDPEGRLEIKTDSEQKIISYRDNEGVKHEEVGLESTVVKTNSLNLTEQGMTEFQLALINAGFNPKDKIDWSDSDFVEIPIPSVCAIINFGVDSQATSKSDRPDYNPGVNADIPTTIEYWDKNGNYFKKPILLSAQGDSSMSYWKKNQGFDLDDGSTIKFGNWVPQDSFHVKKYYIDVFRGQCIVGYWLTEQVYQTRPYGERRPWDYLNQGGDTVNAIGKFNKDFDTGALAHPDGFPVHVFFNGNDAGIYTMNLKKHRDNYWMKKTDTNNIILDGKLGGGEIWNGTGIQWDKFEIRNPKPKKKKDGWELVNTSGVAYNGDFPTELMGTDTPGYDSTNQSHVKSAQTKAVIERLSTAQTAIWADRTKATFEQYFNPNFFIDYFLIANVIWHQDGFWKNWIWCTWDGNIWTPTMYDLDSIFGMYFNGTHIVPAGEYIPPRTQGIELWTNTNTLLGTEGGIADQLWLIYNQEIKARYKELRDNGIFSTDNIVKLLEKWLDSVGYDNLKNDIENVCADGDIPQTPSYRDGEETYSQYPTTGGFYNSILRVRRWLDEHFAYLDSANVLNYNNN